jgi:hypothetical protein
MIVCLGGRALMGSIEQCNDKSNDTDIITKVFERNIRQRVSSIHKFENVTNNSVYRIETELSSYIFKIYKCGWPEEGKLLFVEKKLTEYNIPHAKIFFYN